MKISLNHLTSWLSQKLNKSPSEITSKMTSAGLEIEGWESEVGKIQNVVVGQILSYEKHSNADNLNICQVSDGNEIFQVICGANNVKQGLKTAFAKVGAVLPNDFHISQRQIRGVDSFGMLCSKKELGLGDEHSGIIELKQSLDLGIDYVSCLETDYFLEVNITPNRGDCLSARGLARELSCYYQNPLLVEKEQEQKINSQTQLSKQVFSQQSEECPIYYGIPISGIDVTQPTPKWIEHRLIAGGISCKNIIVDILNYVMIDLGQPMHAFDWDKLEGDIAIRYAQNAEELTLLNGSKVTMSANTLVIADDKKTVAMAGVMGGSESAVSDLTQNIFLESAYFNSDIIRGKSVEYQLTSDAAYRYERGIDATLPLVALSQAVNLIQQYASGEIGQLTQCVNENNLPKKKNVSLHYSEVKRKLGFNIPQQECENIFSSLGFNITQSNDSQVSVDVPFYRTDVDYDYDLIEELIRIYGFDKIPESDIPCTYVIDRKEKVDYQQINEIRKIEDFWINKDYQQTISYSFIDEQLAKLFGFNHYNIKLLNPISEQMNYMRESLIPSIIATASYNIHRQQNYFKIFELANVFQGIDSTQQHLELAGLIYSAENENWQNKIEPNFFSIKNDIEKFLVKVMEVSVNSLDKKIENIEYLHPKNNLHYYLNNQLIAQIGEINPIIHKALKIKKGKLFICNIHLKNSAKIENKIKVSSISKFPKVTRDISFSLEKQVDFNQLLQLINQNFSEHLTEIKLVDCYQNEELKLEEKISYSIRLAWRSNQRALEDNEVASWMEELIKLLLTEFNIELR